MYIFIISAYRGYNKAGYVRFDLDECEAYVTSSRLKGTKIYDRDTAYKALDLLRKGCKDNFTFELETL